MSGSLFPQHIRAFLVDDEEMAIRRLRTALQEFSALTVIGEANDGRSAVAGINSLRPDLVFLDIQMPELNGFEVLNQLDYTPMIVFVTAYEEYAVKAFEKNSLDYLLKPVEKERLALTMERILKNRTSETEMLQKIQRLIHDHKREDTISTIPVKTGSKIQLVHVKDICFLAATDKYVTLHTDAEEKLIEYPLAWLQDRLPAEFIRIHRSYIVNKLKIREIHKYFKGTFIVVMDDAKGSKIKSAYGYYETIKTKLLLP